MTISRKKLIEVALPLDAINVASALEMSTRPGHSASSRWSVSKPMDRIAPTTFAARSAASPTSG